MVIKTCQLELTDDQRRIKSNIRSAWFVEPVQDVRCEAMNRAAWGKWFEVAVLLELAVEIALGE